MKDLLWPLKIDQSFPGNGRMPLAATFDLDGLLRVDVPGVLRKGPEIGYYIHDIGIKRTREFRALIERQGLWDLPGLPHLTSGQPTVSIRAGEYDGAHRSVTWAIGALPAQVLPVMDEFNKLVDEAYASPREVLRGEARWCSPAFSAKGPLRLEVTLQNKGSETISVRNPLAHNSRTRLRLLLSPPPLPDGRPASLQRVEVAPPMVSRPDRTGPATAETDPLAPGQSLRFILEPAAYLSPADYRAVLIWDHGSPTNGCGDLIYGVLSIEMAPLHIVSG